MVVWCLMVVPSALWWRTSLTYITAISVYAIIAAHAAGYAAASAEEVARRKGPR